jgi:hypothetical protein
MKSWKTNTAGIVIITATAILIMSLFLTPDAYTRFHGIVTDVVLLASGLGLIAAKDHDK